MYSTMRTLNCVLQRGYCFVLVLFQVGLLNFFFPFLCFYAIENELFNIFVLSQMNRFVIMILHGLLSSLTIDVFVHSFFLSFIIEPRISIILIYSSNCLFLFCCRRLARRGGVKRISGQIYEDARAAMVDQLKRVS